MKAARNWLQQSQRSQALRDQRNTPPATTAAPAAEGKGGNAVQRRASRRPQEEAELQGAARAEELPDRIAALEAEQQSIQQSWPMARSTPATRSAPRPCTPARKAIEEELLAALERWTDLAP